MSNKLADILPRLVNKRTGIIRELSPLNEIFLPIKLYVYSAILCVQPRTQPFNLNPLSIGGGGRNEEEAISKCLGEAIERYCGYFGIFWKDIIYASYNELKGIAIEPERFALFSKSQYQQPDFPFQPFTELTKIYWVKGKSIISGKDYYVPSQLCFLSRLAKDISIGYATSTGLACGRSYNEAVSKAIYEVIERDAFMLMWLNQLKFPILKLKFENDCWLSDSLNALSSTDYNTYIFILDNDTGISTCITMILNTKKNSPLVSFGGAASLDLNKAIEKSVIESLQGLNYLFQCEKHNIDIEFRDGKPLIKDFSDHVLFYKDPAKYKYISFLAEKQRYIKYNYNCYEGIDENEHLNKLIDLLDAKGYEIIIVDLTVPEFKKLGFWVVRAIMPGFIYLPLGDWIFKGGRRIYEVPERIGFERKREDQLNAILHPFP